MTLDHLEVDELLLATRQKAAGSDGPNMETVAEVAKHEARCHWFFIGPFVVQSTSTLTHS